jgi:hypothetical protein
VRPGIFAGERSGDGKALEATQGCLDLTATVPFRSCET